MFVVAVEGGWESSGSRCLDVIKQTREILYSFPLKIRQLEFHILFK